MNSKIHSGGFNTSKEASVDHLKKMITKAFLKRLEDTKEKVILDGLIR